MRFARWILIGLGAVAALAVGLVLAFVVFAESVQPGEPDEFYAVPSPLPAGPPGTIVRSEVVDGFHAGSTAYRILYKSTGHDGMPTAVSGLVVVPDGEPPAEGRRVIAYTHGTVGVASRCGPSLVAGREQPLFFEGGAALLAGGYVVAAPDYQGLGTRGPHPYLVGESEAMNTLDAVRAARNLPQAEASREFAVWGHSQGGHASLFTGQLAARYAPELRLRGVAAGAPVPNLVDLFAVNIETAPGKILIAMAVSSWAQVYGAKLDQIVTRAARPFVVGVARNCLYNQRQILASIPSAMVLGLTFLRVPPWEVEPWTSILEQNTPGTARIGAPVLVVQGGADGIVTPDITRRFVDKLCANSERVALRFLPDTGHLETGHEAAPAVADWIAARFAGKTAPTTC